MTASATAAKIESTANAMSARSTLITVGQKPLCFDVMAVMVKHLPEKDRKKALFYGLAGAFVMRFGALFAISFLVNVWQVQAIGAVYLLYISIHHILKTHVFKKDEKVKESKQSGFWPTVIKVELADQHRPEDELPST